jgi:hypothetical protein
LKAALAVTNVDFISNNRIAFGAIAKAPAVEEAARTVLRDYARLHGLLVF